MNVNVRSRAEAIVREDSAIKVRSYSHKSISSWGLDQIASLTLGVGGLPINRITIHADGAWDTIQATTSILNSTVPCTLKVESNYFSGPASIDMIGTSNNSSPNMFNSLPVDLKIDSNSKVKFIVYFIFQSDQMIGYASACRLGNTIGSWYAGENVSHHTITSFYWEDTAGSKQSVGFVKSQFSPGTANVESTVSPSAPNTFDTIHLAQVNGYTILTATFSPVTLSADETIYGSVDISFSS